MVQEKWYEQIWVSVGFSPFRWRLNCSLEPYWGNVGFTVGPIWITFGFPAIQP